MSAMMVKAEIWRAVCEDKICVKGQVLGGCQRKRSITFNPICPVGVFGSPTKDIVSNAWSHTQMSGTVFVFLLNSAHTWLHRF